ncbi:MAG: alanine racemase [Asgard group archaeon]|nr:alanine racemase [Asgard group archaeon]
MKIITPILLVNKNQVYRNISKMIEKAKKNHVRFRPHFKTHQSAVIGEWFKEFGVSSITVSSVKMAECFANAGWDDITIAFPVNILEIEKINNLAKKIDLNLLVESENVIRFLENELESEVKVWINIDVGYHRDGIKWDKWDKITRLARLIEDSKILVLKGILTHAGHSYKSRTKVEIVQVHIDSISKMETIQMYLTEKGFFNIEISVGDTPTVSIVDEFSSVDEIRPGNFVFYDLKQVQISSCSENEIAIRFACPIVAKYEDRNEVLIDGGAIHFSKDYILDDNQRKIYGYITKEIDGKWESKIEDSYVTSISQEHGTIKLNVEYFNEVNIGDVLLIIPVHACLATNLMGKLYLTTGQEIEAKCR